MTDSATSREMRRKIDKFGRPPRVLLLSESEGTFGHARVTSTIAKRIREAGGEVAVASGDIDSGTFDFGGCLRKLPLVIHKLKDGTVKEYTPDGALYQEDAAYQAKRQQTLLEIAREFQPDVVAVEFHPLSWKWFRVPDVETLLEYRGERQGRLPFVTIARDSTAGWMDDKLEAALKDFDHILLRGWKEIEWADKKPMPQDIEEKTEHLGHILADSAANDNIPASERPVMVFSSGGHQATDLLFFDKAIEAAAHRNFADRPWKIVVSTECPDEVFDALREKAEALGGNRISVMRTYNNRDFAADVANCEAAIVRGSYNITLELAAQHKPFVVVPRRISGFSHENSHRAQFFAQNGIATAITEGELEGADGAARLAGKLAEAKKVRPVREFSYDNGSQFATRLMQIAMQGRQVAPKERGVPWVARNGDTRPDGHATGRA